MADIDGNLPIFSRGTSAPVVVSKDTSANATANPIIVQLSDGTDLSLIDGSGNLNVILAANSGVDIGDVDVTSVVPGTGATNLGKAEDAAHTTGDVGVMALAVRSDAGGAFGADGDYVPFSITSTGDLRVTLDGESITTANASVKVDDSAFTVASDSVTMIGGLADETTPDSVNEGDIGALRMTLDRKLLTRIVGATDANRWDVDSSGHGQIDIAAVSVTALPVSKDSSANSETNPLFVQVVSGVVSGIEVVDYDTTASVAVDATDNHDYTVTASSTLKVQCCFGSASGAQKIEIQGGPVASLVSKAVQFTSVAQPNWFVDFKGLFEIPDTSTGTLRIIRTNRDEGAMDVYSTIIGTEV